MMSSDSQRTTYPWPLAAEVQMSNSIRNHFQTLSSSGPGPGPVESCVTDAQCEEPTLRRVRPISPFPYTQEKPHPRLGVPVFAQRPPLFSPGGVFPPPPPPMRPPHPQESSTTTPSAMTGPRLAGGTPSVGGTSGLVRPPQENARSRPSSGSGIPGPPPPPRPFMPQPTATSEQSSSNSSPSRHFTMSELQNLVDSLQISIAKGQVDSARHLAAVLAEHNPKIQMILQQESEAEPAKSDLKLRVYIEYKQKQVASIVLKANAKDTIGDLKRKMLLEHSLPPTLQRWIVGKNLPGDNETLESLGITSTSSSLETPVFLYMVSAKFAGVDREQFEREMRRQSGMPELRDPDVADYEIVPRPNEGLASTYPAAGQPRQLERTANQRPASISGPHFGTQAPNRAPSSMMRRSTGQIEEAAPVPQQPPPEENQLKWTCSACTYQNLPTWPGCELCNTERPADFQIPAGYVPTLRERERMDQESASENQFIESQQKRKEEEQQRKLRNYFELLQTDDQDLIVNNTLCECPVCFSVINDEGVVLRECLHVTCRECLAQHVASYDDAQVPCPHEGCNEFLQDREVKALVSPDVFSKYLTRSVTIAENRTPNSYHCKTPDCPGWVIYEDDVNFYNCDSCGHQNCLTCKAIHEGMNCQEYQMEIQIRAQNDQAAKKTQEMLQELLRKGEAMNCPSCLIVLQKKDGCDWMRCSMCKTEICWATRGVRWGPNGPGDTSGGCRCGINRQKCHPQCQNCH